jgi:hypothetical protein
MTSTMVPTPTKQNGNYIYYNLLKRLLLYFFFIVGWLNNHLSKKFKLKKNKFSYLINNLI